MQGTWVRWITGAMLFVLMGVLAFIAFIPGNGSLGRFLRYACLMLSTWTRCQWVAFWAPIAAYLLAEVFHRMDRRWSGGGIRDRVYSIQGEHYNLDPDVLSATMTKQSVLTAIAAILLTVLQGVKGSLALTSEPLWHFSIFMAELSTLLFLISIVLMLVSMKCYDYANRFNLEVILKAELVSKGLDLDIASWYFLLCALVYGVAVLDATASVLLSFLAGYLLWWYYFVVPSGKVRMRFAQPAPWSPSVVPEEPTASHGHQEPPRAVCVPGEGDEAQPRNGEVGHARL